MKKFALGVFCFSLFITVVGFFLQTI
ncbi:hypothetical protein A5876_003397, partial [Enterococcus sp. 3C8_DIV0646]